MVGVTFTNNFHGIIAVWLNTSRTSLLGDGMNWSGLQA